MAAAKTKARHDACDTRRHPTPNLRRESDIEGPETTDKRGTTKSMFQIEN